MNQGDLDHSPPVNLCTNKRFRGFPGGSDSKKFAHSDGDLGLSPELGRSPGGGLGNPLQYSCLENSTDRGAWQTAIQGVAKSWTYWVTNTSLLFKSFSLSHYLFILDFPDSSVGKESACKAGDPSSIPGLGRSPGEGIGYPLQYSWVSLVSQLVKNLPAVQETRV